MTCFRDNCNDSYSTYKGKVRKDDCNSYRGINSLNMPGKMYGRVLNDKMMDITDKSAGNKQRGFRRERERMFGPALFALK